MRFVCVARGTEREKTNSALTSSLEVYINLIVIVEIVFKLGEYISHTLQFYDKDFETYTCYLNN